jgi:murein DD-endopeptidase MepM/ murein hydrolase activator NlpD
MGAYFPGPGFSRGSVFGDIHGNGPHRGADFPADAGTPIPVAAAGVVVGRGYHKDYGYMVIVQHDDAPDTINVLLTLYAHMPTIDSTPLPGTRVVKGEAIGVVGTTGYSTGNHLHLELISLDPALVPWSVDDPWTGGRIGIAGSVGRIDPANQWNWGGLDVFEGESAAIPTTARIPSAWVMCFVDGTCE